MFSVGVDSEELAGAGRGKTVGGAPMLAVVDQETGNLIDRIGQRDCNLTDRCNESGPEPGVAACR